MTPDEKIKQLEQENLSLKTTIKNQALDIQALKDQLEKQNSVVQQAIEMLAFSQEGFKLSHHLMKAKLLQAELLRDYIPISLSDSFGISGIMSTEHLVYDMYRGKETKEVLDKVIALMKASTLHKHWVEKETFDLLNK